MPAATTITASAVNINASTSLIAVFNTCTFHTSGSSTPAAAFSTVVWFTLSKNLASLTALPVPGARCFTCVQS